MDGVAGMDTICPGSSGVDFNAVSKGCNKGHAIFAAKPAPDSIRRDGASHGQRNLRVIHIEQKVSDDSGESKKIIRR